jgi:outer membrane immunogenic protein
MKRFFALTIVFLGLIGLTQIACAGPERMDKNVVPAPAPCDWSGFYLGMNVGVAGLQTDITDLDGWIDGAEGRTTSLEDTNLAVGGQAGYNWQKGAFVFGLEVDADYLNTKKSFTFLNESDAYQWKGKVDLQGSLRARAGIAVDNALIYATSGVAVSHGGSYFREFGESEESGHQEVAKQDDWQAGFVGGVGVEYKFNCHWSGRMEALYSHYPESTNLVEPYAQQASNNNYRFSFQNDVYSVRFGINYLFGR